MTEISKLKKILLVDDDIISNAVTRKLLENSNIAEQISIVTDGFDALSYMLDSTKVFPELIFLDISMPVMDGFIFLKRFTKTKTAAKKITRVIILSQFFRENDIKEIAFYDEVIGYMPKPLTPDKIEQAYRYYTAKINSATLIV